MQVDYARVWTNVRLRGGVRTDENNAIGFDGDGLGVRRFVVRGVNVSVFEEDIGRGDARLQRHEADEQCGYKYQ